MPVRLAKQSVSWHRCAPMLMETLARYELTDMPKHKALTATHMYTGRKFVYRIELSSMSGLKLRIGNAAGFGLNVKYFLHL